MSRPGGKTAPPTSSRPGTSPAPQNTLRPPTLRPPPSKPDIDLPVDIPPARNSLDEVERALSVLGGRHHDSVRVERETQKSIAAKRAIAELAERRAIAAQQRASALRVVLVMAAVAVVVGGGWYESARYRVTVAADAALASLAAPYVAAGWRPYERPFWRSRDTAALTLGANTCVVALSSTAPGDGKILIDRPSGTMEAKTSAAYCTCADEHVTVRTDGAPESEGGGVLLLSQEARVVGGNAALPFLAPLPESLPVSETCHADALDPWLAADKAHGASPTTAEEIPAGVRATLASSGFSLVGSAPATIPFAVVPGTAESCFLGMNAGEGDVSLRVVGGERPLHAMAPEGVARIGWCTRAAQPVTVWHTGKSPVVVYRVDAAHVGGSLGLRDALHDVDVTRDPIPTWVLPTERGWDASAPLLASGIPTVDITVPRDERPIVHARVVSLSLSQATAGEAGPDVVPDPDELDRYVCAPSLDSHPGDALCVQSFALGWRARTGSLALAGIAEAPLPFWMDLMSGVEDRRGLSVELRLLTLARRLAREGYEATARDGVLEEREGIEVEGREGDDRVVAIGVMASAPWVLPYTDGPAWTLEDAPRAVDIIPEQRLHLVTRPWVNAVPDVRRTVVFRHRAHAH